MASNGEEQYWTVYAGRAKTGTEAVMLSLEPGEKCKHNPGSSVKDLACIKCFKGSEEEDSKEKELYVLHRNQNTQDGRER